MRFLAFTAPFLPRCQPFIPRLARFVAWLPAEAGSQRQS
jgi:hypothetical protein